MLPCCSVCNMCLCGSEYKSKTRLEGKTAIVTGANTGIGKCTAEDFYRRGARVIIACRNLEKARKAIDDIKEATKDQENLGMIVTTELDLSSLKSVRKCAEKLLSSEKRIDLLINNAGVMLCPKGRTEDGFETHMGTNHLGHFLFTMLLLPKICQSAPARIVNVSALAHLGRRIDLEDLNWEKKNYNAVIAYQQSKLANILFSKELARRLKEHNIDDVTTYSLHPGVIKTELGRHAIARSRIMDWIFRGFSWTLKTAKQGAQTTIYCAVDDSCANESGLYYSGCAKKTPFAVALYEEDARKLWDDSWKLVGLDENYDPFGTSRKP